MNEDTKIKFYSLGSQKIDLLKNIGNDEFDFSKTIFSSSSFDNALIKVIEKDIDSLDIKINKIVSDIKSKMHDIGVNCELNITYGINDIDKIISSIDKSIKNLTNFKNSNKVGFFSLDKKNKRQKLLLIDNTIDYIKKSKIEIISMSDEYIKLCKRKETLSPEENYVLEDEYEENPLERTINFYIKQKEEAKN